MDALPVVIVPETRELPLEIASRPERHKIKKLPPYRPDQLLDEWMRQRYVRDRLQFSHIEDAQIGLPLAEFEERIVIAAEIARKVPSAGNGLVEHATEGRTIEIAHPRREADDSPGELVHYDHDPVRLEDQRFAPKQIHGPQRILRVSEKREPGRAARARIRSVMLGEYAADDVFVDLHTE
jgi:hypothetical protein